MSTINKKPYIATLVNGLQSDAITELYKCVNGKQTIQDLKLGSPRFVNFKTANHGVNHVLLEVDNLRKVPGYLIWNGTTFVFISYNNNNPKLNQAEIDPVSFKITVIKERLTVEELRRVLYDTIDVKEGVNETNVGAVLAAMGLDTEALEAIKGPVANVYDGGTDLDLVSQDVLNNCKTGDIINIDTLPYIVIKYDLNWIKLICIDFGGSLSSPYLTAVFYDYNGTWEFNDEKTTQLNNPGTKLYKHRITGSFNGTDCTVELILDNASQVAISGAWQNGIRYTGNLIASRVFEGASTKTKLFTLVPSFYQGSDSTLVAVIQDIATGTITQGFGLLNPSSDTVTEL